MLFSFIKNRHSSAGKVYCPCHGRIYPITEVNDDILKDRLMGDGFAVKPDPADGSVRAPVDGIIHFIHPFGYLFTIQTADGMDVVVHVGLDTNREKGKGFHVLKKTGQKVHHGDVVLKADFQSMRNKYDTSVITVLTNCADFCHTEIHTERRDDEVIAEYGED